MAGGAEGLAETGETVGDKAQAGVTGRGASLNPKGDVAKVASKSRVCEAATALQAVGNLIKAGLAGFCKCQMF